MASTSKSTTIDIIIYRHFTRTKLRHSLAERLRSSRTPAVTQENLDLPPFLISLINTRNKKIKP